MQNEIMANEITSVGINTELLFQTAIEKGSSIEALERLMAMRRELKEEYAKESFFRSLSKFQSECPAIVKGKKVMDKSGNKVRFSYAPLDAIVKMVKTPLKDNGFSYTIETNQEKDSVTAICSLHHIDGYTQTASFNVPIDPGGYMNEPQKVATALTYSKRYAFCNATGIMTSDYDNDGGEVEGATKDQIVQLEQLSQDLDKSYADYVDKAIKEGLTKRKAEILLTRVKAKIK